MALNSSDSKKKFTFTWQIENFSFSTHKEGEALRSPTFVVNFLSNTKWYLLVFPRGNERMPRYLVGILYRDKEDDGPWSVPMYYELLLLGADGSPLESTGQDYLNATKDRFCTTWLFIERSLVLLNERLTLLPGNTLTVCCRIWSYKRQMRESVQWYARTRIGVERRSFYTIVKTPQYLQPLQKIPIDISSSSSQFSMNVFTSEGISGDKKVYFEIIPSIETGEEICLCTLSILDADGSILISEKEDIHFKRHGDGQVWRIPLHVTWKNLMDFYLAKGDLSIQGECLVSSGKVILDVIEETHCGPQSCGSLAFENEEAVHASDISQVNEITQSSVPEDHIGDPETQTCDQDYSNCVLSDELWRLREEGVLCDLNIKTKTSTFPAHKVVLCAKSLYFKKMFTKKSGNLECVELEDLDDDTVHKLLLYAYTNSTDLNWDKAVKLYSVAAKYSIICLQSKCKEFLLNELVPEKACELLLLSDKQADAEFKIATTEYIAKHERDVFRSKEWRRFEWYEHKLAIEAFRYINLKLRN